VAIRTSRSSTFDRCANVRRSLEQRHHWHDLLECSPLHIDLILITGFIIDPLTNYTALRLPGRGAKFISNSDRVQAHKVRVYKAEETTAPWMQVPVPPLSPNRNTNIHQLSAITYIMDSWRYRRLPKPAQLSGISNFTTVQQENLG